jgi:hypothetical protein
LRFASTCGFFAIPYRCHAKDHADTTILPVLTEELDGGQVIYRTYGAAHSFGSRLFIVAAFLGVARALQ